MSKVRIYDLAKELKLESKKVLEDARRMGVDVSVPSNTLDDNIAAKIREMYYPKKEQTAIPQKARLIKHPVVPSTVTSSGAPAPQKLEQKAEQRDLKDQIDQKDKADKAERTERADRANANAASQARVEQPAAPAQPTVSAKNAHQPAVKSTPPAAETKPQPASNEAPKARVVKLVAPQPAAQ